MEPKERGLCMLVAALTGALGVISGYAVFFVFREKSERHEHWWSVLLALGVAAAISSLTEWLRDLIRHGADEENDRKHPAVRAIGTVVIVGLFELFITGFHASAEMHKSAFQGAIDSVLGESSGSAGMLWDVLATAGIWVVVGAGLSLMLSLSIPGSGKNIRAEMVRSAGFGGGAGIIGAPLALLAYVLVARAVTSVPYMASKYSGWTNAVARFSHLRFAPSGGLFQMLYLPAMLLGSVSGNVWVFLACMTVLGVATVAFLRGGNPGFPGFVIAIGTIVAIVIPLVGAFVLTIWRLFEWANLKVLLGMLLLALVTWGVPGVLLGCLVPLLRGPSSQNRKWGLVGYIAALLLAAATLLSHGGSWPYFIAALAFLTGVLFQSGAPVEDYWPFAALSVAIGICGAMSLMQHATFAGTVKNIHAVNELRPREFNVLEQFKADKQPWLVDEVARLKKQPAPPPQPSVAVLAPPKPVEAPVESSDNAARELEIAITGSLGFWTTVGLLACWKIVEVGEKE